MPTQQTGNTVGCVIVKIGARCLHLQGETQKERCGDSWNTLKMQFGAELTSATACQPTRCRIIEDFNLHKPSHQNLKSRLRSY
jgi:hypothetical protein